MTHVRPTISGRRPCPGAAAVLLTLGLAGAATAQEPFSAAARVNDDIVTHYELEQRALFLEAVRTPGDLRTEALEALVDERLQMQEARRAGTVATPVEIEQGLAEFAARAELGPEEFLGELAREGIAPETVRDFIATGVSWRNLVRDRFGPQARVTDAELAEASLLAPDIDAVQIRFAEIVLPLTPRNRDVLRDQSAQLAQELNFDTGAFSDAARRFSAAQTARNGGVTDWRPLSAVPSVLRDRLVSLRVGETSTPIQLGRAFAIFQLRGIRESDRTEPPIGTVDFATIPLPGIQAPEGQAAAASLRADIDVCDDLYGRRPGAFERRSAPLPEIERDIGLALSALDANEISFETVRANGAETLAVMLCARRAVLAEDALEALRDSLFSRRLTGHADGLLEDLRATAIILQD